MSFPLFPDLILKSLTDLTPDMLRARGVEFLMMDFDNTIVPYTTDAPTDEMRQWLANMQDSGIRLCVVSNSKRPRVKVFCEKYGLNCITHAKKPFQKGIRECLATYQLQPQQAALVGDQIYTDVLGAKSGGNIGQRDSQPYRLAEAASCGGAAVYRRGTAENCAAEKETGAQRRKNLIILSGYLENRAFLL